MRGRVWRLIALILTLLSTQVLAPASAADQSSTASTQKILVMVRHPPDHYRTNGAYGGGYDNELARSAREHLAHAIAHKYGLTLVEDWPMPMIGVDCFVMAVPRGRTVNSAIHDVSSDAEVAWAEPVENYGLQAAPPDSHNDPLYWAEPAAREWHLAALHQIADGRGTRVAVIDSGIDARHPDLSGQLLLNRNFVAGSPLAPEQHGTAVAGIIAAKADNRIGIAGVAPGARLFGLRACRQSPERSLPSTTCDTLSLARALYFAVENHADVINLSLSGPDARLLREIIKVAYARGTAVVAAFDPKRPDGGFPASVPGVIAVSDVPTAGAHGEVYVAPGRGVPTTEPGGRWTLVNGSSFAAAHVSGLIALMRERKRAAPLMIVTERNGFVNACATLVKIAGACDCACTKEIASTGRRR